jgi:hypothetical protein
LTGVIERILLREDAVNGGSFGACFDTEVQRGVALGIEVHQADFATAASDRCCEIDTGSRLADSTLLIHDGDNAHPADPALGICSN